MAIFIDFLLNNYIWFLIISLIIIFTLIGYLVDLTSNPKKNKKAPKPLQEVEDNRTDPHPSVEIYTNEIFDDPLIK